MKKGAEDFPLRPFHLQAVIHSRPLIVGRPFSGLSVLRKKRRIHHQRVVAGDVLHIDAAAFGVVHLAVELVVAAVSAPVFALHAVIPFDHAVRVFRPPVGAPLPFEELARLR